MGYKIAHLADTHLGYVARCRTNSEGVNERFNDGVTGYYQTIEDILNHDVDLVVHGGDLFHQSAPGVAEIAVARRGLAAFARAGLPVYGATGNHDFATDRGKLSATAAVNDPDRNIHMVTGSARLLHPTDGINIHIVSHAGLIGVERAAPDPTPGDINIFVTHGAAQIPGTDLFTCADSPGEAVVGYDMLTKDWDITLLGHYHSRGALPGFDKPGKGQAWYAGSLLRRGFSDAPGGRGWLLVEVDNDTITVTPRNITQRPQNDLPTIDAAGKNGAQVEEEIRHNLDQAQHVDGAILRQRVTNCPVSTRRSVNSAALNKLTEKALIWQLEFRSPTTPSLLGDNMSDDTATSASLATAGGANLPATWGNWFDQYAEHAGLPPALRPEVKTVGGKHLADVSAHTETHDEIESGTQ